MISSSHIQLSKASASLPFVNKLIDEGEGIGIFDCDSTELVIVNNHLHFSVFFGDKKTRGGKRRFGGFDMAGLQKIFNFFSQSLPFCVCNGIDFWPPMFRFPVGYEFYGMIPGGCGGSSLKPSSEKTLAKSL
jgi:hypothetical protein